MMLFVNTLVLYQIAPHIVFMVELVWLVSTVKPRGVPTTLESKVSVCEQKHSHIYIVSIL